MYVNGATAKSFIDAAIGTVSESSPALSYLLAQENEQVYIDNGIDGSAVTGVSINDSLLLVSVSVGSITWADLYAYETYWLSTEEGIRDEGRFTEAKDTANYSWFGFKIKNISSPSVPLVITGGYGIDGDTGAAIDLVDTTGGTIFCSPDHVVSKIVTVTGGNVITGDIADISIPSAEDNAAAVVAASLLLPLSSNVVKVNNISVSGAGTEENPWGPS
jgi:hypothetical protein